MRDKIGNLSYSNTYISPMTNVWVSLKYYMPLKKIKNGPTLTYVSSMAFKSPQSSPEPSSKIFKIFFHVHLIIQLYFDSYEKISTNTYQRGSIVFKEDMCRFSKNTESLLVKFMPPVIQEFFGKAFKPCPYTVRNLKKKNTQATSKIFSILGYYRDKKCYIGSV
jgi:hypothetical protein